VFKLLSYMCIYQIHIIITFHLETDLLTFINQLHNTTFYIIMILYMLVYSWKMRLFKGYL